MNKSREVLFTYVDVKNLLRSNRKKLFASFFLSFLFIFSFLATKNPQYKAEGLFQVVNDERSDAGFFEKMLGKKSLTDQKLPISLMLSKKVLLPIIEDLGLQASIEEQDLKKRFIANAKHNFFAELYVTPLEKKGFSFHSVHFLKRIKETFYLSFSDPIHFEVLSKDKKVLKKGKVGMKCVINNASFSLDSIPKSLDLTKVYSFTLSPIKDIYEGLIKNISIEVDENAESLLKISCKYKDPYLAKKVVNRLMSSYETFLQKEADEIANTEMGYLQKKRKNLFLDLQMLLNKSVAFQKEQIKNQHLFPVEEKLEKILEPYHKSREKLFQINSRLQTLDKGPNQYLSTYFTELQKIQTEIEQLKGQKKLYAVNIASHVRDKSPLLSYLGLNFSALNGDKRDFSDEVRLIDAEIESIKTKSTKPILHEKIKLLGLRKKLLEKRSHLELYDPTLEGIDTKTAKGLLSQSYQVLNEKQSSILNIHELKKQVDLGCELSALNGRVSNLLFQDMIKQSHVLSLKLKDKNSLTSKEEERYIHELAFLKKVFVESLDQQEQLEQLLLEKEISRIHKLNTTIQDRIDQKIEVGLLKQKELISSYQSELASEKSAVEEHLNVLAEEMALIPDQWKLEKELQLKTKMVLATLDSIGKVLEEKSFISQLKKVGSKPIDRAQLIFLQERPLLWFLSIVFAIFCFFISCLILFLRRCLHGFHLSEELLQIYGQDVLGSFKDEKRVIYETANFITKNLNDKKKIVSLIQNSKEYAKKLSSIFMKRGYKVIIVDGAGYLEKRGWIDHLENNAPLSIEKTKLGHFLYMGKRKNTLLEHISSLAFLNMMNTLKKEYDLILLACDANPSSLEARATLTFSDQVILTITKETLREVESFLSWKRNDKKLGFLIR